MPRRFQPSQLVVAAFSRHEGALDWAADQLSASFGAVALRSPDFDFHHTTYYARTMGAGLKKRLLVFEPLRPATILPQVKNHAIGLENVLAVGGAYPEPRPLNLDPGLLQLGRFLLASTKDQSHRTYLGQGIYVENTLRFEHERFGPWPWTYADYREPTVLAFLEEARTALYRRLVQLRDSSATAEIPG